MSTEGPTTPGSPTWGSPGAVPPPPPPPPAVDAGHAPLEPFAAPSVPRAPAGTLPPPSYGTSPAGAPPVYGTPPPGAMPAPPPPPGWSPQGASRGPVDGHGGGQGRTGTAALVLGIVAFVLAWVPFVGIVALPLGVVALVLGIVARRRRGGARPAPAGRATAGVVLGTVAVLVAVVAQVSYVVAATTSSGGSDARPGDVAQDDGVLDDGALDGGTGDGAAGGDAGGGAAGGDASDVPPWEPMTVEQVAFGPEPDQPGVWWYVAVIDNPNAAHRFGSTEMSVEALGADGTLLVAEWAYADVLPGRTAVSGTFRELGDRVPDRVDVRLPLLQPVTYAPGAGRLTVGELTVRSESWGVTVEGTVSSTLDEDTEMAQVVVVAAGPDGEVVAAARGYAFELAAGGDAAFDATFYQELPAGTTYTAYVAP
ncbi:hypothetical protein H9657_18310 [Cellulomonas sp. Sa3CUA2]|uniref:DUF4190 domain-containing protein n=1 Tax=Cellulomonas avistercoris TaxID=2762242 RepID=A0ABR8QIL0_9CELL|nr:hypothetical protein [Cellulomonas avistercoris]MBD7920230.1 hypothetical protein [Cellulomonas avistercoris]